MPKMRAIQVSAAKGPLERVEREMTEPVPASSVYASRHAGSATATY